MFAENTDLKNHAVRPTMLSVKLTAYHVWNTLTTNSAQVTANHLHHDMATSPSPAAGSETRRLIDTFFFKHLRLCIFTLSHTIRQHRKNRTRVSFLCFWFIKVLTSRTDWTWSLELQDRNTLI